MKLRQPQSIDQARSRVRADRSIVQRSACEWIEATFAVPLTIVTLLLLHQTANAQSPQVEVSNVRRVFHNGQHNAFTDLIKFNNRYYLTFRSCPDGHMVHPTASIIVLSSVDLKQWDQVHRFHIKRRDTRDPHFVVFKNRLFVYTGTWYSGDTTLPRSEYEMNLHLGYAAWSDDGTQWNSPIMLEGTFGHYIWRAATHDEKVYLCGRRKIDFTVGPKGEGIDVESVMLESDDGLVFKKRALFQEIQGDETAFQFSSDGSVLAIGRRATKPAEIIRSQPPYAHWERHDLDRYIGGPLLAKWNNRWIVGGRKNIGNEGPKTAMYWLVGDQLEEFAQLPSGGDNSYPGFIPLDSNHAVMSWYSSHEKNEQGTVITAIYMADLTIK
jgi:hypothetical protein